MSRKKGPPGKKAEVDRMSREIEREQALRHAREESLRRALHALEKQDDALEEAGARLREILRNMEIERNRKGPARQG